MPGAAFEIGTPSPYLSPMKMGERNLFFGPWRVAIDAVGMLTSRVQYLQKPNSLNLVAILGKSLE